MQAPDFWRRAPGPLAWLLSPFGWIYGAASAARMARPGARGDAPVICVGNFVAGGAGKTPTAIALADLLRRLGERPVFLSRGYGRRGNRDLIVDLAAHDAEAAGDEPLLLARHAPAIVARDRLAGMRRAAPLGSVIVMDDGLQNPTLAKDFALAVVDGESGIGNGYCLPAGPLRAPLAAQLAYVDAVLVIGAGEAGARVADAAHRRGTPVLRGRLAPDCAAAEGLRGRRVFAFAGIGRPEKFFATLEACGARVAARRSFPDHYRYRRRDLEAILLAAEADALLPVTTKKDFVRLTPLLCGAATSAIHALPVGLVIEEPNRLKDLVVAALARARSRSA